MSLNLITIVNEYLLSNPNKKFTARQIAEWIYETYPKECEDKQKKSLATITPLNSEKALIQQIVAEIGSQRPRLQKKNINIKATDGRPRKYYYTEKSDVAEIESLEHEIPKDNIDSLPLEHDLYPILIEYLNVEHNLYVKRIDEKRSSNNRGPKGNEWLYPDLVALEDLASQWSNKVSECAKQYGDKKAKLWSFEVKRKINSSNVRSTFFQSVSNSSWANYGYLVAAELDANAKSELRMLSSLHGIGFIELDILSPADSQIIIPAQEKFDLDWDSINRLVEANSDFQNYIEELSDFCLTGKTKKQDWD
jgi:hypothetical protein